MLFAHVSRSGRHSPRNRYVAKVLQEASRGTFTANLISESSLGVQRLMAYDEIVAPIALLRV
ncbi:MAG: hypothetical protein M3297_05515 [Thermoproteota archaeon]|nr:hypothetical protein [Thermoproteota archaeon]